MIRQALLFALFSIAALPACKGGPKADPEPAAPTQELEQPAEPTPVSVEVELKGAGYSLPATLVLPGESAVPCVVFFAGSGPTDRDWLSAQLPGKNGSAAQLAASLAAQKIGSLRFDKVGSGENMRNLGVLSLDHYRDEGVLAFGHLDDHAGCGTVFLLGNSEGSIHAFRTAVALADHGSLGGVISMAGPSRRMLDLVVEQIRNQQLGGGADRAAVDATLAGFRDAVESYPASKPPSFAAAPQAEMMWRLLTSPQTGALVRALLLLDPLESARAFAGASLILSAAHDIQVPTSDGDALFAALPKSGDAVRRRVLVPNASHVFKVETRFPAGRTPAELAQLAIAYTEAGRELAPGTVEAISGFIRAVEDARAR